MFVNIADMQTIQFFYIPLGKISFSMHLIGTKINSLQHVAALIDMSNFVSTFP